MNRRQVMTSLPVAAASVALPAHAALPDDPILTHYQAWLAARAEWYRLCEVPEHDRWDTPEMKAAEEREDAALEAMIVTSPVTFAGVAALAHAIWNSSGPSLKEDHPEFPGQCQWVENRLIAALWRATSGRDGLPPRAGALFMPRADGGST